MTTMNESMVSSSPITVPYGQDKSNKKKRSISSSILNFFNRINYSNGNNENEIDSSYPSESIQKRKKKRLGYINSSPSYNNSSNTSNTDNNNSDFPITHNKGTNSNMEQPLILYKTDDTGPNNQTTSANSIRPPVLPILPIQRLKLLRRKQMLRLKMDTKLIQNIDSDDLNTSNNSIKQFKSNNTRTSDLKQYQTLSYPEPLDLNQSVAIHKPDTPSPVKNPSHIDELILDSTTNNIVINNKQHNKIISRSNNGPIQLQSKRLPTKMNKSKFKGTRWSGNFEYDLSEYDTKPKSAKTSGIVNNISNPIKQIDNNKSISNSNSNSNSSSSSSSSSNSSNIANDSRTNFESGKTLKIPISKLAEFSEIPITNKKLSKSKLDLLIHGSKLQPNSKHNEILLKDDAFTKDANNNSKKEKEILFMPIETKMNGDKENANDNGNNNKKSSIVLPTAGFDFLADDATRSKNVSFSFNNQSKVNDDADKKDTITEKPLFSFSNSIKTRKDNNVEKKQEDKTTDNGSKLSFAFNTKSNLTIGQMEESVPQKPSSPAVSIDLTKDIKKPTFTFTSNKNPDTESKPLSFSFGSQSNDKSSDKLDTTTPKFSFGSTISKSSDSTSIDTTKTLSFSFGAKSTATSNNSGGSRDNKNTEDSDEDEKRPRKKPTFSFTAPSTTNNKNSDTGISNASSAIKRSFSFGFGNNPTDKKNDDGKEADKPTNISLRLTNSSTEKKSLPFSFGSTPKANEASIPTSLKITPAEGNKSSSLKFATNISNTENSERPGNTFFFEKNTSGEQAPSTKPTATATATASTGEPSFTFGAKPATGTSGATQSTFSFNNKIDLANNKSSAKPSFTFGTTTGSSTGKLGTTDLSKPTFTFGATNKETTSNSATISTTTSSSFNKPAGIMNLQLNNDAKSLGVSLSNPLLSKPGSSDATNNGTSTSMSGASGGFKFTRQQGLPLGTNISQQNNTSSSGTLLFGGNTTAGMNSMQANNVMNNNNNNIGNNQGFNFTFNASNNNNSNNSTMNSFGNNTNSGAPPGGSVFSFNNNSTSNNMFSNNNNMNSASFQFGQQQQSQMNTTFHPSSQVNINFNQNANANPVEIFSGSMNNNNSMGNVNNTITPQPNQFPHRKIARMRASRR